MAFSSDGGWLATGGDDNAVWIRDGYSGLPLVHCSFETLAGRSDAGVRDVAFHPNGKVLAAACADSWLRYFNPITGDLTHERKRFKPDTLEYLADGSALLLAGKSGRLSISLDFPDEKFLTPKILPTGNISCASSSDDSGMMLTGTFDASVFVWQRDGQPVALRTGHGGEIRSAVFSPGDAKHRRVISASSDGRVSVWPVDPLAAALARKPRDLYSYEKEREARIASPLKYE